MVRSLALLAVLVAVASSRAPAQDLVGPKWTPLSFSVAKPGGGRNPGLDLDQGTQVVVRVELPGQNIVAGDLAKCRVDSFTDDLKTDLLATPDPLARPAVSGSLTWLSKEPNNFTFRTPGHPAKGATKVRIKGSLTLVVGTGEKELEKKDVELKTKAGVDLGIGTIKMKLDGFNPAGAPTFYVYDGNRPLTSVALIGGDGKEIRSRLVSSMYGNDKAGKPVHQATITVPDKKVERCTVRVKYYDTVEEVKVPFDLEVGPGL
ncbi:MAG: hypothetical protein C0501_17155 [Isosphaera sp.]|nr:hypothetical protein [Isosphaera sp.]